MVLNTNINKTVGMVFHPCQVAGTQLEAEYGIRMTRAGPSYQERQRGRIQCKECGGEMEIGSMEGHMKTQHGRAVEGRRRWEATDPGEEPRTYRMALPTNEGPRNCPVEGCLVRASTRTTTRVKLFQ